MTTFSQLFQLREAREHLLLASGIEVYRHGIILLSVLDGLDGTFSELDVLHTITDRIVEGLELLDAGLN